MASFFSELANNNIRGSYNRSGSCPHWQFPRGYLERLESSEQTTLSYVASASRLIDYQGDELFMDVDAGKLYDFTITTPPIPKGVYEVRIGYMATGGRGVCQFYFNGIPTGVPVNLLDDKGVRAGYVKQGDDPSDPDGFENDKVMRNLGYMKAPASFWDPAQVWTKANPSARRAGNCLRKILGIFEFEEAANHKLTVKGLSNGQFMMDFMEFVPTSALETEDIY